MRLPILAAAILILSLTLPNLEVVSASDKPSVSFSVETDRKSYVRGEVVRITLNAKNTGVETVTYSFGNECEGFRIMILNSTGSNLGVSGFGPPVCRYATRTASNMTQSSSFLSWTPAEDNVGVIGYGITANGTAIFCCERGDTTSVAIFFLEPGTTYLFKVVAADSSANWNMDGPTVTVTTPP